MAYHSSALDYSSGTRLTRFRANVAALVCLLMICTLLVRLGWLQIIEYSHFSNLSENNRVRLMALPPNRGLIYDRNGIVLAENRPTFHLEITPEQVKDIEATLQGLGEIVSIDEQDIKRFRKELDRHRPFESISLRTRLDDVEVARLAVNRHRFPGMDISARLGRYYPQGKSAVHAIGYVGRINEEELGRIDRGNYRGTSYIGKTGLEKFYEEELHGLAGQQNVEVNSEGRILSVVDKIPPVPGKDLILTLDIKLQKIAEEAMGEFSGSVIAIEPQTGEILAFVSKPMYDPNAFVHGISFKDFKALREAEDKPLFNRAIHGQYPPGSTYKPFVGLAGKENSTMAWNEKVYCKGFYRIPDDETRRRYRDWKKTGHGSTGLNKAMEQSCDVYFYELSYRLGIDKMFDMLDKFGFGKKTGIDLPGERNGLLPSREWKRRVHGKKWFPGETLIAGIGQGYMLATPLQLVVATATLANKGVKVQPHLLRKKHTLTNELEELEEIEEPVKTTIKLRKTSYWDAIHKSMKKVVHGTWGTAKKISEDLEYVMAGKTGTAQVFGIAQDEKYDAKTIARKLRDHGLFIAFAPYKNPSIAVAVIAENGEHGSAVAPVARKVMDAYLNVNNKVSNE